MLSGKSTSSIELSFEVDIEADCAAVYDTLNLHSPRNRYLRRGFTLTPQNGPENHVLMKMPNLPKLDFFMSEHNAIPNKRYDIHCDFPPGKPVGILNGDHSSYRLTPLPGHHCRLKCIVEFQTIPLSKKAVQKHSASLIVSLHDDLARLKVLVEDGVKAAEKAGALDEYFDALEGAA